MILLEQFQHFIQRLGKSLLCLFYKAYFQAHFTLEVRVSGYRTNYHGVEPVYSALQGYHTEGNFQIVSFH